MGLLNRETFQLEKEALFVIAGIAFSFALTSLADTPLASVAEMLGSPLDAFKLSLKTSAKKEMITEVGDRNEKNPSSEAHLLYTFETKFTEKCGIHGLKITASSGLTNVRRVVVETKNGTQEILPFSEQSYDLPTDLKNSPDYFISDDAAGACIKSILVESDREQDAEVVMTPFFEKRTHLAQILVKNGNHKKDLELAVVDTETGSENIEYLRMDVRGRGITLTKYRIQYCEKNFAAIQDFNVDGGITIPADTTGHKILLSGEKNCVKSLTLYGRFLPQTKERLAVISIFGVEPSTAKH